MNNGYYPQQPQQYPQQQMYQQAPPQPAYPAQQQQYPMAAPAQRQGPNDIIVRADASKRIWISAMRWFRQCG